MSDDKKPRGKELVFDKESNPPVVSTMEIDGYDLLNAYAALKKELEELKQNANQCCVCRQIGS